jgi:hypothetical protein
LKAETASGSVVSAVTSSADYLRAAELLRTVAGRGDSLEDRRIILTCAASLDVAIAHYRQEKEGLEKFRR